MMKSFLANTRFGLTLSAATIIAAAGTVGTARAQTNSLFGSRGPASQIGSNLTGSPVGRSTTMGLPGSFGTGTSGSSIGSGRTAFNSFGSSSPLGLQSGAATTGAAGTAAGTQQGFIGRSDNAGRFVGNQQAGRQTTANATRRTNQRNDNRGGGRTGDEFGGNGVGGQAGRTRTVVRPQQRIGFSYQQPDASSIVTSLTTSLARISASETALAGVTVSIDEIGVATLHGEVDSEETKKLAAIVVRLEPGVRTVNNQLVVRGAER